MAGHAPPSEGEARAVLAPFPLRVARDDELHPITPRPITTVDAYQRVAGRATTTVPRTWTAAAPGIHLMVPVPVITLPEGLKPGPTTPLLPSLGAAASEIVLEVAQEVAATFVPALPTSALLVLAPATPVLAAVPSAYVSVSARKGTRITRPVTGITATNSEVWPTRTIIGRPPIYLYRRAVPFFSLSTFMVSEGTSKGYPSPVQAVGHASADLTPARTGELAPSRLTSFILLLRPQKGERTRRVRNRLGTTPPSDGGDRTSITGGPTLP